MVVGVCGVALIVAYDICGSPSRDETECDDRATLLLRMNRWHGTWWMGLGEVGGSSRFGFLSGKPEWRRAERASAWLPKQTEQQQQVKK